MGVSFWRESEIRKAIFPRLETNTVSNPVNSFRLMGSDTSSMLITAPSISLGNHVNGSINTLKVQLRIVGDVRELRLSRTNPTGTNAIAVKGDYKVTLVSTPESGLPLTNVTVIETNPAVLIVPINGAGLKSVDIAIEFKSAWKSSTTLANVRTLIMQSVGSDGSVKNLNLVCNVI